MGADAVGSGLAVWYDHGLKTKRVQPLTHAVVSEDAFEIPDENAAWPSDRQCVLRAGDDWWMGMLTKAVGIESFFLSESGIVSRGFLVPHETCTPSCLPNQDAYMDARHLSARRWQDELWFGFEDHTDVATPSDPVRLIRYRLLRVAPECVYPTAFDLEHGS